MITTHPRKIYFYLTTQHHQPIPQHEADIVIPRRSVISPALSDEEDEDRRRSEMSPSPEVDLSSHELDDCDDAGSDTNSILSSTTASMIDRQRTRSPSTLHHDRGHMHAPLEGDEREFSQSAIYMDRRSRFRAMDHKKETTSPKRNRAEYETDDEHEHADERTFEDAATTLLSYATVNGDTTTFSSPNLAPETPAPSIKREDVTPARHTDSSAADAEMYSWNGEFERHLGSPENVNLEELDELLDL